jgi:hypothetical protein
MGISISKTAVATDEATELVQLHIFVKEGDWFGTFDEVEVWRSRGLSTGPYEELTADSWRSARIPADAGDQVSSPPTGPSVTIVGEELQLKVNEKDDLLIIFTGVDPLTYADCATQIQTQGAGRLRSYVDESSVLVIETSEPGTGAILRIVGGDAAPKLGLPLLEPSSLAFGRDGRIQLMKGREKYAFNDIRGNSGYFYKTRFRNRMNRSFSEFSQPSPADQSIGISGENIVCGQLQMVRLDGKPLRSQLVRVFNRYKTQQVEDRLVAGPSLEVVSDMDGKVQFFLVRGSEVTVSIDGTDIVRDIEVPTDPEVKVFNLLDPALGPDDYFKVRVPVIEYAQRRTL